MKKTLVLETYHDCKIIFKAPGWQGFSHKQVKLYCSLDRNVGQGMGFAWCLETPAADQAPCAAVLYASPLCSSPANLTPKLLTGRQTHHFLSQIFSTARMETIPRPRSAPDPFFQNKSFMVGKMRQFLRAVGASTAGPVALGPVCSRSGGKYHEYQFNVTYPRAISQSWKPHPLPWGLVLFPLQQQRRQRKPKAQMPWLWCPKALELSLPQCWPDEF